MRTVITAESRDWLRQQTELDSVITSLPDLNETGMTEQEYRQWFFDVCYEICNKTQNYAIFYQTDRKLDGKWIDKSFLVQDAAEATKTTLRWHKVVLRKGLNEVDMYRPGYTHLLCFSKTCSSGKATPDILERGYMTYPNAMGMKVCEFCCDFIKKNSDTKVITDPFCGRGSVLAVAESYGFDAFGVDILPDQCKLAKELNLLEVE